MKKFFNFILLLLLISSCVNWRSQTVSRSELQPSLDPNIKMVELQDGSIVEFNSKLGWYNAKRSFIEGVSIDGVRDTILISKVQNAEIREYHSNAAVAILSIIVLFIGIGIVFYKDIFPVNGGCMVAFIIIGAGITGIVIILVQV